MEVLCEDYTHSTKLNETTDEQFIVFGDLVYESTFVEKWVNRKCEDKCIEIEPLTMREKCEVRKNAIKEKNREKKGAKYDIIIKWWGQRNKYLHTFATLTETSLDTLNQFIGEVAFCT